MEVFFLGREVLYVGGKLIPVFIVLLLVIIYCLFAFMYALQCAGKCLPAIAKQLFCCGRVYFLQQVFILFSQRLSLVNVFSVLLVMRLLYLSTFLSMVLIYLSGTCCNASIVLSAMLRFWAWQ